MVGVVEVVVVVVVVGFVAGGLVVVVVVLAVGLGVGFIVVDGLTGAGVVVRCLRLSSANPFK